MTPLREKMTEQRLKSPEEWELMYRLGLTQGQIAELCSTPIQEINRSIGWAKRRNSSLQEEHLASRPPEPQVDAGLTREWLNRRDALAAFIEKNGRTPSGSASETTERHLAKWVSAQRSADRKGKLLPARRMSLDSIGKWYLPSRAFATDHWRRRLEQLATFQTEQGRLPSYKNSVDPAERLLGVWLHVQRQQSSRDLLSEIRRRALDEAVPGWNTWRSRLN